MDTEKYKLYTKGGDKGRTSLVGGQRVPKYDIRLESYGTIDELNSFVGVLLANELEEEDKKFLFWLQHKLFSVGGYLATDTTQDDVHTVTSVTESAVARVEREIDRLDDMVPPIKPSSSPRVERSRPLRTSAVPSAVVPSASSTASIARRRWM